MDKKDIFVIMFTAIIVVGLAGFVNFSSDDTIAGQGGSKGNIYQTTDSDHFVKSNPEYDTITRDELNVELDSIRSEIELATEGMMTEISYEFVSDTESSNGVDCEEACSDSGKECLFTIGGVGDSIYEYDPSDDKLSYLYSCQESHRNLNTHIQWCICKN